MIASLSCVQGWHANTGMLACSMDECECPCHDLPPPNPASVESFLGTPPSDYAAERGEERQPIPATPTPPRTDLTDLVLEALLGVLARVEASLMEGLREDVENLRTAVAIAISEMNTKDGSWGRNTAIYMMRALLKDQPPVQEIPWDERRALRDKILPPVPPPDDAPPMVDTSRTAAPGEAIFDLADDDDDDFTRGWDPNA